MLTEVMEHFSLVKEFPKAGYYETEHQKQMFKDIKVAIHSGKLVAIKELSGVGRQRLYDVCLAFWSKKVKSRSQNRFLSIKTERRYQH
jgi:ABC-type lipoprotein export system ATPase subunit